MGGDRCTARPRGLNSAGAQPLPRREPEGGASAPAQPHARLTGWPLQAACAPGSPRSQLAAKVLEVSWPASPNRRPTPTLHLFPLACRRKWRAEGGAPEVTYDGATYSPAEDVDSFLRWYERPVGRIGALGGADGASSSSLLRDTSAGAARCLVTGCLGRSQGLCRELSGAPKRCKLSTALPVDRATRWVSHSWPRAAILPWEHATVSAGQYPTTLLDYPHNLVLQFPSRYQALPQ